MKNLYMVLITLAGVIGCGGGGGGDTPSTGANLGSETGSNENPVASEPDATPSVSLRSITDLSIPEDVNYHSVQGQTVAFDISALTTQRAYLTLYSAYVLNQDGTYSADYASKLTSSPLTNGVASVEFCAKKGDRSVLAEIWFYDGTPPIQKEISYTSPNWIW